jgi:hypothetical protein
MKKAGDILSALFDENFVKKAHGYSKLFDCWEDITAKNGIAAAAAHSRIKELDRGILSIEMDHPGWKQILQTKQTKILNDFRIRFPEMDISGISLILGSSERNEQPTEACDPPDSFPAPPCENSPQNPVQTINDESVISDIENIKDEDLKQKLLKLGQTIAAREEINNKS